MKQIIELDKNKWSSQIVDLHKSRFDEPQNFKDYFFQEMFKDMRVFGVIKNQQLISMAFSCPKVLVFNNQKFNCQLLSAICTDKNFVRQGNAFDLIAFMKRTFKSEGVAGLYLCPVKTKVYESSGFIPFCFEQTLEIKYDGVGDMKIKRAGSGDLDLLLGIYNKFMSDKNAYALRSRDFFKPMVDMQDIDLIYDGNTCVGYIAFDGYYYETCADIKILQSVKDLNARKISVSVNQKQSDKVSQMICVLDSALPEIQNDKNINFDRYC
jgi:predicted acetyltransferase